MKATRKPEKIATGLSVPERVLLFCIASRTDWQKAGITGETVTLMVVKGLVERDAAGRLLLAEDGWAAFEALLKESGPKLQLQSGKNSVRN
jgi:hypothetical protein